MEFEEAVKKAEEYGSEVAEIVPNANWIQLAGAFTPDQLRAFADEIERRYGNQKRPNG